MYKIRYIKSKTFNCCFYECAKCGLDIQPWIIENANSPTCKNCGTKFTREEIVEAKNRYIAEQRATSQ